MSAGQSPGVRRDERNKSVILVIASQVDETAREFVSNFPEGEAALLTCRDLSSPGWHISSTSSQESFAIAGGSRISVNEITGILTLIPAIYPLELTHIIEPDRDYVASEMTAFLLYWLNELTCPVLNRPTPGCLTGPAWRFERWAYAAMQLDIPTLPYSRSSHNGNIPHPAQNCESVIVIGNEFCGSEDNSLRRRSRLLADKANVDLLTVSFANRNGYYFSSANTLCDVSSPILCEAIFRYFKEWSPE
jgi:hypothetical protein